MGLAPGTRLGPYEIVAPLGAGGMGEVYRAKDTKLNRDVALKILPDAFTSDADRLVRFRREAQVLASLNHPHIAAIYGFEDSSDTHALVMELVEGEDLSALISRDGGQPLADAVSIARQVADALEAAHEQGIIHRDLKPANIKVRADGTVKVLDFGLAKAMDPAGASSAGTAANSPTLTAHATQLGMILGTAAYMAPEQARGKSVDKRADIWAFGVVVYEMLTGERAFKGEEVSDVLAAVLRQDIDWATLPAGTPAPLRRLLARCLERDVKKRLRDIGEARVGIDDLMSGAGDQGIATAPRATTSFVVLGVTAIVSALAVGGAVWLVTRSAPIAPPLVQATILPPAARAFEPDLAVSDRHVAFVAGTDAQLFIRPLAGSEATPIAGVTGADYAFFSPDGQWLGFHSFGDKRLKKVPLGGGPASVICEVTGSEGSDWGSEGIVISERVRGLSIVSPDGGGASRLVLPSGKATFFAGPMWLPGGRSILYTEVGRIGTGDVDLSVAKVMMLSLASGATPVKVADGYAGRFVPPHALVFERENTLLSVSFDPSSGATSGERETVRTNVASFAVSPSGTLVVYPLVGLEQLTFVWVDRQGHLEPTGIPPGAYRYPRISPDGTRIVISSSAGERDLWIWNLGQKALTRLTTEKGADSYPVWTPDGGRVIYGGATEGGDENLTVRAADGTGGPQVLLSSGRHQTPYTISPDSAWVVFRDEVPDQGTNLDILDMRTHEAKPLLATKFNERNAEISPDGHLMAYQSDETGKMEVYVRPFPNVDAGKRQISNSGGVRPAWSRDGRRLYYMTHEALPATMNVVERKAGAALDFGAPAVAFDLAPFTAQDVFGRIFDIGADGRFLMPKRSSDTDTPPGLTLFLNWAAHLGANR